MELSPEEKLDKILKYLAETKLQGFIWYRKTPNDECIRNGDGECLQTFIEGIGMIRDEMIQILWHLKAKGYVHFHYRDEIDKDMEREPDQIKISFDGRYFYMQGGYVEQKRLSKAETDRILLEAEKNHQAHLREQDRASRMVAITFWMALGTLAAAIYYLNELCCSYQWFCFCNCH